ncbi:MAG TPA: hypothetical protein VFB79_04365 [Candidatus Angelobacter sp.]|nr:hypothetical protein [Candidatus Angelobacter sp.]
MRKFRNQKPALEARLWGIVLVFAIAGSWGCGGGSVSASGPTPTPTPVSAPTPTPTTPSSAVLELKVLDTSIPPGGIYQFQLSTTEPKPIGHGSTRPQVPPGTVRGVSVNDPSGQAVGIAVVDTSFSPSKIAIQLASPAGLVSTLGTDISYPIVTLSMPLSSTLTPGQTFTTGIDAANSVFADASNQNYPTVTAATGTLTIAPAGSPYISDVIPGGGLLADRSTVRVLGSGFNANTRVSIEGTTIIPSEITFVNAGEIDVKLCNGTVPDGATTCPNTGATFQLDGERVRVKDQTTNFVVEYYSYIRADDVVGSSSTSLVNLVHPMYSHQTYASATIPLVNTATQFTGLSMQNTSGTDAVVDVNLVNSGNAIVGATVAVSLPTGKKITRDVIADWFGGTVPAGASKVKISSPVNVQVLGMLGDKSAGTVSPVIPQ